MRTRTWKKRVVAIMLAFVMVMGTVVIPVNNNCTMVAAATKKDKKKPKLTMEGKSKMTVTKGKSVTIPKVTAKDNKDGNVTKKIKVTVKKGKKSYSSIAKKIKNNKSVKFTATGKYVITYTVTDKAGNKATKKRYVTVKNKQNTATTTEDKTEQATTETPTTETQTTEQATTEDKTAPTTEATTQEQPNTETPTEDVTPTDYSKYNITEITYDGNTYKVVRDEDFGKVTEKAKTTSDKITLTIENDYDILMVDKSDSRLLSSEYLKFLGSLKATDENGNDISDRIVINETALNKALTSKKFGAAIITIYVEDNKGNSLKQYIEVNGYTFDDSYGEDYFGSDYKFISEEPKAYARLRKSE